MIKVLEGVKVLDMGTFITGPAAGMFLADLGAEVIKIENPDGGDPFRAFRGELYSPHFQTYNRNKKSVTLNTKQDEDRAILDAMVKDADVFIQNFRPGVADRLNVSAERLQGLNPNLIYCAVSGFGQDGPERDSPAFDTVAQAASGFLRLLVNPENPRVVGPALADAVTGFYAAYGVLGALFERFNTGKGRLVEVSMLEAMCHFNLDDFTHYFSDDQVMTAYSRPNVSQSYVFETSDRKWLALHMSSPTKFWENLALSVGKPDMLDDPRFKDRMARIEHYDDVVAFLKPIFLSESLKDWCAVLSQNEVPHSPMYTSKEVTETAQFKHLDMMLETEHPVMGTFRTIRSPLSFDHKRPANVTAPPVLGEHDATIKALYKAGR
ncbi:CaiB/BaiF CoA transferase family protein [Kordiimonas aestuarii]|uniref:CaiB/BaiF CoA transferase family protein n=1 Tax=Kordiimonas aestuarii TaxID=1005925 RepID=UPI0021CEF1E5|nr:CaiB/BaiF CoA-transferase family protein [Kordiimonas aestuarii]